LIDQGKNVCDSSSHFVFFCVADVKTRELRDFFYFCFVECHIRCSGSRQDVSVPWWARYFEAATCSRHPRLLEFELIRADARLYWKFGNLGEFRSILPMAGSGRFHQPN